MVINNRKRSWVAFQLEEEVVSKWFLTFQVGDSLFFSGGVLALSVGLGLVLTMSYRGLWFSCGCLGLSPSSDEEFQVPVFLA